MDDCLYRAVSCKSQGESHYRNYKTKILKKEGKKGRKKLKNTLEQNV